MSYDVSFYWFSAGVDPMVEITRRREHAQCLLPTLTEEERRRLLVADLLSLDATLKMEPSQQGFAYGCYVVSDEDDCMILPIDMSVGEAFVCFSYSANFDEAFESLRKIMTVFERHGYVAFDPQQGKLISSQDTFTGATKRAEEVNEFVVNRMVNSGGVPVLGSRSDRPKKPWWKFW